MMAMEESAASTAGGLKMRSIYVSSPDEVESAAPVAGIDAPQSNLNQIDVAKRVEDIKDAPTDRDDAPDHILDPVQLPQSTHSFLFTESVCSLPFWYGVAIILLSFFCLGLALTNNVEIDDVPVNVTSSVRWAQYLSILVALLMEEEIPTGLYLLRRISRESLHQQFPQMKYGKFVISSIVRITAGYYFLFNVLLVLVKATSVIEIFYDCLALQFIQQLDDIAFNLAKMDVFGKTLQRASSAKCFRAEFEKRRSLGKLRRLSIFLKTVYFLNLCAMLAGMAVVSIRQINGYYQHDSITIDFGDTVWGDAWVRIPTWLQSTFIETSSPGELEEWTLVYSFFNGVYVKEGSYGGRPIYREQSKFDRSPYDQVVPAEIKFCEEISAWVFTHESILRTRSGKEEGCNWLLRSPETDEFDLLNVEGNWEIWVGVIGKAKVSIASNLCSDNSDCNLNGDCIDGTCYCYNEDGAQYLGTHCEVRLKDSCKNIIGEFYNSTWYVTTFGSVTYGAYDGPQDIIFQEYSRPVYTYDSGNPEVDDYLEGYRVYLLSVLTTATNTTGDEVDLDYFGIKGVQLVLVYSGSRWFGVTYSEPSNAMDALKGVANYHAFWSRSLTDQTTILISDPTTGATPVGTDFYEIGDRGEQFGPFGALRPVQKYNQTGRGVFRCSNSNPTLARNSTKADRLLRSRRSLPGL